MSFYESPIFVEILLIGIYVMLLATVVLTVWSAIRAVRMRQRQPVVQGIPVSRIAWGVVVLLIVTLGATCLLADTTPLPINGTTYNDTLWLRLSDMFINTSAVLISVATLCVIASMLGIGRKMK